jgi:hypothetical protein
MLNEGPFFHWSFRWVCIAQGLVHLFRRVYKMFILKCYLCVYLNSVKEHTFSSRPCNKILVTPFYRGNDARNYLPAELLSHSNLL